jgi:hypothetical protein
MEERWARRPRDLKEAVFHWCSPVSEADEERLGKSLELG